MQIILSVAEHHANLVPWQLVAKATGAILKHVGLTPSQELDMDDLRAQITPRTKILSLVHVSNTLGCVLPVDQVRSPPICWIGADVCVGSVYS